MLGLLHCLMSFKSGADVVNTYNKAVYEWKHPVETAKTSAAKAIDAAREFKAKISKFANGKGAAEIAVLSVEGKTAKQHSFDEMQKILNEVESGTKGKRQIPKSLEVAVHKETGEIIIGKNKGLKNVEVNPQTKAKFKEGSLEQWSELNCSEADVVNQIYEKGHKPSDYEFHAVEYSEGTIQDKHTCRNCDVNMKEEIEAGSVTSNTSESKARRDINKEFK